MLNVDTEQVYLELWDVYFVEPEGTVNLSALREAMADFGKQ